MSPHEKPDDLSRLLRDAVDDVEPRPGIETIRSRTSLSKESPMTNVRTWFLGGLGAAVATAAVIGGVVLVGSNDPSADRDDDPVDSPTGQVSETPGDDPTSADPTPTDAPSPTGDAPGSDDPTPSTGRAMAVYFVGDTPRGPRLYREFRRGTGGGDASDAVEVAVSGDPLDPDYRSPWPDDAQTSGPVTVEGDVITVDLTGDVHDLPAGMTAEQAQLAVEQVIFTAQGAVGQGRLPVQFLIDGGRTDQILGQPASEPLANGPVLDTNSHVQLSTPNEGDVISDGTLEVTGAASSNEANVVARLQRWEGNYIAFQEPITAEGWMGDKLFPFGRTFDVSDVAPGRYVLMVSTDDPSGGEEGFGPFTDSRVITIE